VHSCAWQVNTRAVGRHAATPRHATPSWTKETSYQPSLKNQQIRPTRDPHREREIVSNAIDDKKCSERHTGRQRAHLDDELLALVGKLLEAGRKGVVLGILAGLDTWKIASEQSPGLLQEENKCRAQRNGSGKPGDNKRKEKSRYLWPRRRRQSTCPKKRQTCRSPTCAWTAPSDPPSQRKSPPCRTARQEPQQQERARARPAWRKTETRVRQRGYPGGVGVCWHNPASPRQQPREIQKKNQ
jgi:hypothetical protein